SLTGIPPTALFFGKFFLFAAAINTGFFWLAVVGILNSVVSLFYYAGVIRAMYQMPAPAGAPALPETSLVRPLLTVPVAVTVFIVFFLERVISVVTGAATLGRYGTAGSRSGLAKSRS